MVNLKYQILMKEECKLFIGFLDRNDCDWFCDECDAYLNCQLGFTTDNDEWICRACGAVNDVTEDNIILFDDEDDD